MRVIPLSAGIILILVLSVVPGCAVDQYLAGVDETCNAMSKTKAQYRKCLREHYQSLRDTINPPIEETQ